MGDMDEDSMISSSGTSKAFAQHIVSPGFKKMSRHDCKRKHSQDRCELSRRLVGGHSVLSSPPGYYFASKVVPSPNTEITIDSFLNSKKSYATSSNLSSRI